MNLNNIRDVLYQISKERQIFIKNAAIGCRNNFTMEQWAGTSNDINEKAPAPGEVLLEDAIKPLEPTITGAAKDLGVNRKTLSALVNSKSALTSEMAIRIAHATKTSPESWLNMQTKLDL